MYEIELLLLVGSGYVTYRFLREWYTATVKAWPDKPKRRVKLLLGALPVVVLLLLIYTLRVLASFDVVDDLFYIIFYILLGFAWLHIGIGLMTRLFDLSWRDDVLHMNNQGAAIAVAGGVMGQVVIYAAANIGDGPGWWCVLFPAGLGLVVWLALGMVLGKAMHVFERITVERDRGCGIRMGGYLLASGLILGRASAGDWTSWAMTVVEFLAGWPVLVLAGVALLVEGYYRHKGQQLEWEDASVAGSVLWGLLYIGIAITAIYLLPPLPGNVAYSIPMF